MKTWREDLVKGLFETRAIRVCPANSPFWYTSGKIGPYYINTHFLYGNEDKANSLLKIIDSAKEDKKSCSETVLSYTLDNYRSDGTYKKCIDTLLKAIKISMPDGSFDYISGGERRDWFFSLTASVLLDKPHITIFKDLDTYVYYKGKSEKKTFLDNSKLLHIADLITTASSYERAWIPAIKNASGNMTASFVIIDRMQGGHALLKHNGVASHALIEIDRDIFEEAYKKQYINLEQYNMVLRYIDDPDRFMKEFFLANPGFIEKALESDERTAQRAKLCIESGYYPV